MSYWALFAVAALSAFFSQLQRLFTVLSSLPEGSIIQ